MTNATDYKTAAFQISTGDSLAYEVHDYSDYQEFRYLVEDMLAGENVLTVSVSTSHEPKAVVVYSLTVRGALKYTKKREYACDTYAEWFAKHKTARAAEEAAPAADSAEVVSCFACGATAADTTAAAVLAQVANAYLSLDSGADLMAAISDILHNHGAIETCADCGFAVAVGSACACATDDNR